MWQELGLLSAQTGADARQATRRRHNGTFVFCYGHVEGAKPQKFFDVHCDDVLKRWNRDNLPHRELIGPQP
jgi:hypothetical protein